AQQSRLAHPCGPEHGDELSTRSARGTLQGVEENPELPGSADHRGVQPTRDSLVGSAHAEQAEGRNALGLALELQRFDGLDLDRIPHQTVGGLSDEDLVSGRRLLEARRRVDRIPRDQSLTRRDVPRHDLARIDAGAVLETDPPAGLETVVDPDQRLLHVPGRAYGAERVVLVQAWEAEDGHHRVADELLDRASMAFEDGLHLLEVDGQHLAKALGVETLAEARRPLEIAEDDRDRLANLLLGSVGNELGSAEAA